MPLEDIRNELPSNEPAQERPAASSTEEIALSQEDRFRIGSLFADLHWRGEEGQSNSQTVTYLREQIRREGRKAAACILEQFENDDLDPQTHEGYRYIRYLDLCASPAEAKRVASLLMKDKVALHFDRSAKGKILDILTRIGTPEIAEDLGIYATKSLQNEYARERPDLVRADIVGAYTALLAIYERQELRHEPPLSAEDRMRVTGEMQYISDILLPQNNMAGITISHEAALRQHIIWIQDAFNYQFERAENIATEPQPERPFDFAPHREGNQFVASPEWSTADDAIADEEFPNLYQERRGREIEDRLQTVKNLRHEIKKEKAIKEEPEGDDETRFLRRHWLEYREKNPSPLAPTLGIEIEIRYPKELKEPTQYSETDNELNARQKKIEAAPKKYEKTEALGVPRGRDAFWEFAHNPVRNYLTLSREVQALIEMELIDKHDQKHPLHLTIGGITSEGEKGRGAFVLCRILEASAWSVRGRRLLRSYYNKNNQLAWDCKGKSGIKERTENELQLDTTRGVEMRTFQLQTLTGLDRLLRSAYLLGAALKAHQEIVEEYKSESERIDIGESQPENQSSAGEAREKLAAIWKEFQEKTRDLFYAIGLADPESIWDSPHGNEKSPFFGLAALLDEAEANPKSHGAEFVRSARNIIIHARAKAAEIIYPKREK